MANFKTQRMASINPYIHFNGNAEIAFSFYKSVLGGEFTRLMRYKDLSSPEFTIPESDANRIMHIVLPIDTHTALVGSDVMEMMGRVNEQDNRNTISLTAASREEADRLFNGLSAGGTVEMPIAFGPLGSYFGMFADQFGVQWMVQFTPENN